MKQIISLVIAACIVTSCSKNAGNESGNQLDGSWELRHKTTGLMPTQSYPEGNRNRLTFSGNNYELWENGVLIRSGVYISYNSDSASVETCATIAEGEFQKKIIFMPDFTGSKRYYQLDGTTLKMIWGCAAVDGKSIEQYEKIGSN